MHQSQSSKVGNHSNQQRRPNQKAKKTQNKDLIISLFPCPFYVKVINKCVIQIFIGDKL